MGGTALDASLSTVQSLRRRHRSMRNKQGPARLKPEYAPGRRVCTIARTHRKPTTHQYGFGSDACRGICIRATDAAGPVVGLLVPL